MIAAQRSVFVVPNAWVRGALFREGECDLSTRRSVPMIGDLAGV
jgi:hypothetical protein